MRTKQAACLRTQVLQMSPARVLTTGCLEGRFGARDLSQRRWLHLDLATAAVYKRHSRKVPALSRRNFHEDASVAKLVKAAHPRLVDVSRHDPTRKAGSSRTGRRCADGQTAGVAARCRCFTCLCASSIETRRLKDRSLRGAYWRRRKSCEQSSGSSAQNRSSSHATLTRFCYASLASSGVMSTSARPVRRVLP